MLRSISLPDGPRLELGLGWLALGESDADVPLALGYALFDAPARRLPRAGTVDVELVAPLDGRAYRVRRALDVPEHWHVQDVETGWQAATGAVDTERWLRASLDVPEDLPLARLFLDLVWVSVPVSIAWLLEEPGLRERKMAALLRTDGFRSGLRWLEGVIAYAAAAANQLTAEARLLEGRDQLLDAIRQRFETARAGALRSSDDVAKLDRELAEATAAQERLQALQTELQEVRQDIASRRVTLAGAEVQVERWRHWLATRDRAAKSMLDHQADWQAHNEAIAEMGKLAQRLAGFETLQAELQAASADALALQREEALIQQQLSAIQQAETAAADLAEPVHHQQQVEQQLGVAQERMLRLDLANKQLQTLLAESKRVEVMLGEVERQLADLDQLAPQAQRVKKTEQELAEQQSQLREATRQVDHLHFVEAAARSLGGHLDELRKGAAVSERLLVKAGVGNGAGQERTVVTHLQEAIDRQIDSLERQVRDWQNEARDLAAAPTRVNQLRSTIHQLEQELGAARGVDVKLGGISALRQNRKQLRERFEELQKLTDAALKEQQEHAGAPATASQLRQELSGLNDPRSERLALLRQASRKETVEAELRQVQRTLQERREREAQLEGQLKELTEVRELAADMERQRQEAHEGYCAYRAQEAIVELAGVAEQELEAAVAAVDGQRRLLEQAEAHETALVTSIAGVEPLGSRVPALQASLAESQQRAAEWNERYELATQDHDAADANRAELMAKQAQLATHRQAEQLLTSARATIQRAEVALGTRLRTRLASIANQYLVVLLDRQDVELSWAWHETPALVKAGVSHALDELGLFERACCALALRLALAADASRLGAVIVSGLETVPGSQGMLPRLEQLPGFDQFLLASA